MISRFVVFHHDETPAQQAKPAPVAAIVGINTQDNKLFLVGGSITEHGR
jgi:hypothetical protein